MNKIKLTLLGIMVVLTAGLRAQIQQRNWMVFQPSSNQVNLQFTPSPLLGLSFPRPMVNNVPITAIVGSNAAVDPNGNLIFYVITTTSSVYIFDKNNNLKYQEAIPEDEYAPREIPIINYKCNTSFDIWINSRIIKYDPYIGDVFIGYNAQATINGNLSTTSFGINLLDGTRPKTYVSMAISKSEGVDEYDLYTISANFPGITNRSIIHCKVNPTNYSPISFTTDIPIIMSYQATDITLGTYFYEYQSNIEVSPNKQYLAFADDRHVYIYNLNPQTGNVSSLHSQYNYEIGQQEDYRIAGLEFSNDNGKLVFTRFNRITNQTQHTNSLGIIDIGTSSLSYVSNTGAYAHSEIELGRNGELYMATATGLQKIDAATGAISNVISSVIFPLNNGAVFVANSTTANYSIRNLPEQIDGINNSTGRIIQFTYTTTNNATWTPASNPFCANCNTVYMLGDLNIKHDISIEGINFEFINPILPGRAKIQIDPLKRLTLTNCKLKSNECSGMWEGIVGTNVNVQLLYGGFPGNMIPGQHSSIEDALTAIKLDGNNAKLTLTAAKFNKNRIHLNLSGLVVHFSSSYIIISHTDFLHTLPLKDANVTPDGFGHASIVLNNNNPAMSSLLRINNCTFTGGQFGITSTRTKVECVANTFTQIKQRAISISGIPSQPNLVGINLIENNFTGNRQHVFAFSGTTVYAIKNTFANSQITGIDWLMNKGCKFIMGDANNAAMANTFNNNKQQAISCALNTHANTEIKINRNNFIGDANSGAIYISEASNSAATLNGSYKRLEMTHNNMSFGRWGIRLDNVMGSQVRRPIYLNTIDPVTNSSLIDQTTLIQKNNINYNTGAFNWSNQNSRFTEGVSGNNAQGVTFIENTVQPLFYPANKSATRTTRNAAMRFTHGRRNMIYKNTLNGGEGIRSNFDAMDANIFCNVLDHYVNGFNFNQSVLRDRRLADRQDRTHGWMDLPRHNNFSIVGGGRVDINIERTSTSGMRWWFGPTAPFVRIAPLPMPVNHNLIGWIREGSSFVSNTCLRPASSGGGGGDPCDDCITQNEGTNNLIDSISEYYNNWYSDYMQYIEAIHSGQTVTVQNIYMQKMALAEYHIAIDSHSLALQYIQLAEPSNAYEANYKTILSIWLEANHPVVREYTSAELNTLFNIGSQSSLVVGPAATMARIYLKMALDTLLYEPEIEEQFGIGGWLEAVQCSPYYFANAQVGLVGDNFQLDVVAIADSNGRFYIEPEVLQNIDADATFDLVIHTINGDMYAMDKNQTLANWINEPEVYLYKNCGSAALVGLNKELTGMEQIKAYPIPTTNVLNITGLDLKMGYKIIITDVSGKELINQQLIGSNTATISTGALNAGVYFANIKDDAGITKTIKFVK
jgi:hypothetical protein